MADADPNSIISEGPFAGLTVQQALDHATAVHAAAEHNQVVPAPPKPPVVPPVAPNGDNVDTVTLLTLQRLEQDDETAFASSVADYATYKARIDDIKKNLHPVQRMQKGLHKRLYENLRLEEPGVQDHIYGRPPAVVEPPPVEELVVVPPVAVVPPVPVPVVPRPAPPTATPTPASRVATPPAPGVRKPKLIATPKVTEAAGVWGMTVDEYLISLEDRGMTQDELDKGSSPRATTQQFGSTAYGRTRSSR